MTRLVRDAVGEAVRAGHAQRRADGLAVSREDVSRTGDGGRVRRVLLVPSRQHHRATVERERSGEDERRETDGEHREGLTALLSC